MDQLHKVLHHDDFHAMAPQGQRLGQRGFWRFVKSEGDEPLAHSRSNQHFAGCERTFLGPDTFARPVGVRQYPRHEVETGIGARVTATRGEPPQLGCCQRRGCGLVRAEAERGDEVPDVVPRNEDGEVRTARGRPPLRVDWPGLVGAMIEFVGEPIVVLVLHVAGEALLDLGSRCTVARGGRRWRLHSRPGG